MHPTNISMSLLTPGAGGMDNTECMVSVKHGVSKKCGVGVKHGNSMKCMDGE